MTMKIDFFKFLDTCCLTSISLFLYLIYIQIDTNTDENRKINIYKIIYWTILGCPERRFKSAISRHVVGQVPSESV